MKKTLKNILPIVLLTGAVLAIGSSCGPTDTPCTTQTYYLDADGDGYGTDEYTIEECEPKDGYVSQAGDCDDSNPNVNPGANETPFNDIDDNCNGVIDECETDADCANGTVDYVCIDGECQIATVYYADTDSDGFGDPSNTVVSGETAPEGYLPFAGDCDDTNPDINVAADEIMNNGIDDNCDGLTDQGVRYIDADGDGYGSQQESAADGVFNSLDCDDTNPDVHPYQNEIPGNGIDDNCDGITE